MTTADQPPVSGFLITLGAGLFSGAIVAFVAALMWGLWWPAGLGLVLVPSSILVIMRAVPTDASAPGGDEAEAAADEAEAAADVAEAAADEVEPAADEAEAGGDVAESGGDVASQGEVATA